jgi:hypothetical protein
MIDMVVTLPLPLLCGQGRHLEGDLHRAGKNSKDLLPGS